MHVPGAHSATFRRIFQRGNIPDSYLFLRKPKRSLQVWKCRAPAGLVSYSGEKALLWVDLLDLFGNHPALHPLSSHRCADAPFSAAGAKSLRFLAMNSRLPFPGPPAIRPGRKGTLTTCLFCQLFSRTISCTPSECVVLNERRIGKSCKRNNVN